MDYGILDFVYLIGSLGLFLYGMKIMSEGLQKIAGERMKSILAAMTSNPFLGILTGITVTALIQSSSATTLMVVSFVNAGLLKLTQAISVIMGANIGTTATAWIISLLGFKVDISLFAIPLVAIAIPLIFSTKSKLNSWGEFVLGFSLLFLGLQFLKDSMPDLQNNPEALAFLQQYTDKGFWSVLLFVLIGTVLTFLVQSSSATVAITLVMCSQGWIPFEMGTAMIFGENIGTTITANLAAMNANINAKRTAFSHTLFNIFGVIWILAIFSFSVDFVSELVIKIDGNDPRGLFPAIAGLYDTYEAGDVALLTGSDPIFDPEMSRIQASIAGMGGSISIGLSLFHTLFNVANTLVMVWFIPLIAKICERVIRPSKKATDKKEYAHLQFLSTPLLSTSELSLLQVNKEVVNFATRTRKMLGMVREMIETEDEGTFEQTYTRIDKYERICDRMEVEIVKFLTKLSQGDLRSESRHKIQAYLRIVGEVESIGDACYNMARIMRRKFSDRIGPAPILYDQLLELQTQLEEIVDTAIAALEQKDPDEAVLQKSQELEHALNERHKYLAAKNIEDIENGVYSYLHSLYYLDMLDEYELLGDYAMNVVESYVVK